ncbi:hypothetical protein FMM05_04650 [Flavobacterium zepuense]|uniref:Lipoprotein n=1 Tax=Flavobacterium zepuense TaxID=2593302 RepID=A0A552V879_9FLAO|nr:hypothetical protein [Flavobacterium zepuense]TRW26672.1 hypothetical protein FMM05_04650 [Flavobacterium zepuense]
MKTNLLRFKVFAFFLALLLLTNCQEDEISVTSNQQSNVTQRMISLDDIQSMPGVMNALSKFKLQSTKENSISQKIIYNSKYDFILIQIKFY